MRRRKLCLLLPLLLVGLVLTVSAHPGRTDENGGHYDRSTGEYHFHHGYPAHQHPDGVCPYSAPATEFSLSSDHGYTDEEPYIDETNKHIDNDITVERGTFMSSILNHLEFLGFCLLLFTIFSKIVTLLVNIIQIPFAIISRNLVYLVLAIRTYFLPLFLAVCTWTALYNGLMPLPYIIVFAFVLYGEYVSPYNSGENDDNAQTYIAISAVAAVILFLVFYFSGQFPGQEIPLLFFRGAAWLVDLPIIGSVLTFIMPLICIVVGVLVTINAVLIGIAFLSTLIGKLKKPNL